MSSAIDWGEWIGLYEGHFPQVIQITQAGPILTARKVTGDNYIPAGEITWQYDLTTPKGQGHASKEGGREKRWVDGRLVVTGRDRLRFEWEGIGAVEFRADDL